MIQKQPKPFPYDDIAGLHHHISTAHPPMPMADRAAQFSPFAALTSYHAAIREAARFTDEKAELDENAKALLDEKMQMIRQNIQSRPKASVLYFLPDKTKAGGAYMQADGRVKNIDSLHRSLLMQDGASIPIDDIVSLEVEI